MSCKLRICYNNATSLWEIIYNCRSLDHHRYLRLEYAVSPYTFGVVAQDNLTSKSHFVTSPYGLMTQW